MKHIKVKHLAILNETAKPSVGQSVSFKDGNGVECFDIIESISATEIGGKKYDLTYVDFTIIDFNKLDVK